MFFCLNNLENVSYPLFKTKNDFFQLKINLRDLTFQKMINHKELWAIK